MSPSNSKSILFRAWPVDVAHFLYVAATLVTALLHFRDVPDAAIWIGVNVVQLAVLAEIVRRSPRLDAGAAAFVRLVYTVIVIPLIFTQLGSLVPFVNPRHWEDELFRFDLFVCGGANPIEALEKIEHPLLTEVLQWIYNYYFFIPVILGVAVVRKGRAVELARMLCVTVVCIYLSYVGYYLVPATGPNINKFDYYRFENSVQGLFMTHEFRLSIAVVEKIKQDCFPSGHTAVSLTALLLAYRYARSSLVILWPLVLGLVFSTLYLRYHYVADVLAGILLAFLSVVLGERWHRAFERRVGWGE